MKIIRTVLIASALVGGAASAQAQVLTNIHGGPANPDAAYAPHSYTAQRGVYSDQARAAYAQHPARAHRAHPVYQPQR